MPMLGSSLKPYKHFSRDLLYFAMKLSHADCIEYTSYVIGAALLVIAGAVVYTARKLARA